MTHAITFSNLYQCRFPLHRLRWCAWTRRKTLFLSHFYTHNFMWAVPWSPKRSPDLSPQVSPPPPTALCCLVFSLLMVRAMNPPNSAVLSPGSSIPFYSGSGMPQIWISYLASVVLCNDGTYFSKLWVLAALRWIKEVPSGSKEKMADSLHDTHSTSCHWLKDCTNELLNSLLNSLLASLFC